MNSAVIERGEIHIGGRITLRPIRADYVDGLFVAYLRNRERRWYWNQQVVTPDSHIAWCYQKSPRDMVWIVQHRTGKPIGLTSLTVEAERCAAEYGRTVVDPLWRGNGYGREIEYTAMLVGFELFQLSFLWGELIPENPIAELHDKIGWRRIGLNVPGHLHDGYDVLYIECLRHDWARVRQEFTAWLQTQCQIKLSLGEWTP